VAGPQAVDSWRDIVLYGANTATYKFALGRSLLELARTGASTVSLEDLAVPFSRHMVDHVRQVTRQSVTPSNRYVALCRHYLEDAINETELHSATMVYGFRYVLDAFHKVVGGRTAPMEFYRVHRSGRGRELILSDDLLAVAAAPIAGSLDAETETRWSLVERTWQAKHDGAGQLTVAYERPSESLVPLLLGKRRPFRFGVRPALNGYQHGFCFYCYRPISVLSEGENGSDVDHFLPFSSFARGVHYDLESVWNLVLACRPCNSNKYAHAPAHRYLPQLAMRNEWLIASNHPLRETVIAETGATKAARAEFLRQAYQTLTQVTAGVWETQPEGPCPFAQVAG
jgi:5-methylcytosine-specific restriction endonuclease McrA